MRRILTLTAPMLAMVLATATGCAPAGGQFPPCTAEDEKCFALWNSCMPIAVAATAWEQGTDDEAMENEVSAAISRFVVGRLQASGITTVETSPEVLAVSTELAGTVYSVDIDFWKSGLRDPRLSDDRSGLASTWPRGGGQGFIGPTNWEDESGASTALILLTVQALVDGFINEYLEVNAPACAALRDGGER